MKKSVLVSLVLLFTLLSQAQVSKSVTSTSGGLAAAIGTDISTVTNLTITGTIDATDFVTMYNMPLLAVLDLSAVTIDAYTGDNGPLGRGQTYLSNAIPATAFKMNKTGKTSLTTVILPATLTSVGNLAFGNCSGLTSITIPSGVTTIGGQAFDGCTNLTSLTFAAPSLLTTIQYSAFSSTIKLTAITIPATVTSIASDAFNLSNAMITVDSSNPNYSSSDGLLFNKNLTTLMHCPISKIGGYVIPSTVTTIDVGSFSGCKNLTSISIPFPATTIGSSAFNGCSGLTAMQIPPNITVIGDNVFSGCAGLTAVSFPSTMTSIGYSAFYGCKSLKEVSIPSLVNNIGDYAFLYCDSLSSIDVDATNNYFSSLNGVLFNKAQTKLVRFPPFKSGSYSIPTSVTNISYYSFHSCNRLTSVTIPAFVSSIGYYAFSGCIGLGSISIPASVTSIGTNAFASCIGLTSIYAYAATPVNISSQWNVFGSVNKNACTLYVPVGSMAAYKAANQWMDFANISEGTSTSSLSISTSTLNVASAVNSTATFSIASTVDWTVTSNQSWLTLSNASGSNNATITVTATANTTIYSRIATVTIAGTGVSAKTVTITQAGTSAILNLSTTTLSVDSANNSIATFDIVSNTSWSVSSNQTWLTVSSATGANNGTITITATSNPTSTMRGATITVLGDGVNYQQIDVTQAAGKYVPSIILSKTSINLAATANSSAYFDITSNTSWSASSNQTWLTVNSAAGSNNKTVYVNAAVNKSIYARTATVTVSATGVTSKTIEITQAGKDMTPTLSVTPTKLYLLANENSKSEFIINSNSNWNANSNQSWLTLSNTTGCENKPITVTAAGNTSGSARSATVTISGTGVTSKTITVTQTSGNVVSKTINIYAGGLYTALSTSELQTVTNLTLTGTIDSRDFLVMRDSMPELQMLDLSGVTISSYIVSSIIISFANAIPANAFYNSAGSKSILSSIVLPTSIISIESNSFYNCCNLTSISIPSSVKYISGGAFYGCIGLTTTSIPASVVDIGNLAFQNSSGLITVGNGYYASVDGLLFDCYKTDLMVCPSIKTGDYVVPSTVKTIRNQSFANCVSLNSVFIPSSVTAIDSYSFHNCSALLTVDANNTNFSSKDGVLFNKNQTFIKQCPVSKTGSYSIPTTVTSIGEAAFYLCTRLTSINIPSSVTFIDHSVFEGCTGLTSITIPSSVTSIGPAAFYGCEKLSSIYANSILPIDLNSSFSTFNNVNKTTCTLYVPVGSVDAYRAAPQWQDFLNIVENVPTTTHIQSNESINLYPNPLIDAFSISGLKGVSKLALFDLNGNALLTKQVSNDETISVSSLPKGIFVVKITTNEGTVAKKIVKQ